VAARREEELAGLGFFVLIAYVLPAHYKFLASS